MNPHEKLELVDEDALPVGAGSNDWPEEEELLTPPLPADLPEERPGDPGSDFSSIEDDRETTDPGWAETSADMDPSEFEDDGLLELQE
ncbi:MAG: hypothetical protein ACI9VR_003548 [Cognaticolwellia sp.]|jgi:hypothetical protein